MSTLLQGILSLVGRVLLCAVFFLSAVANKIPNYLAVAQVMERAGLRPAGVLLVLAIAFLIAGSLMIIVGWYARVGAFLLFVFLLLATLFFHDFWNYQGEEAVQLQIHFMKNLSLMGAMLLIMANGVGPWSLDARAKVTQEAG